MKSNAITTSEGIEVYTSILDEYADIYINNLLKPEEIYNTRSTCFDGMIKYIYINYFKYNPLDYDCIDLLDDTWDSYTSLCFKYNHLPIIIEFCRLVGINRDTIHSWENKKTRAYIYYTINGERIRNFPAWKLNHKNEGYIKEPSTAHADTVKKWKEECEAAQYRNATERGAVGSIFALKANYGYTETAPIPTQNPHQIASRTPEEIAQSYGIISTNEPEKGLSSLPE